MIGVSLIGTLFLMRKARRLSPGKQISVLRSQIVRTAKDVEAYHQLCLTDTKRTVEQKSRDEALYTRMKNRVMGAVRVYNGIVKRYERYGKFARSERQQVVAALAATARTAAVEIRRIKRRRRDG
jgi:hypothetical protein